MKITPGRAVVLLIVALGVTLAGINVWFRYATTSRIHERWGTEALLQIADAPRAELWELTPTPWDGVKIAADDAIAIGERQYRIGRRTTLIGAKGFVHLRNSLGQDASYSFSCDLSPPNEWRWAIAFSEDDATRGDARTVVLFDSDVKWAAKAEKTLLVDAIELSEKMSAGIATFLDEQTED